jgi:diguanylate cyclase (GGDEF)-like protein
MHSRTTSNPRTATAHDDGAVDVELRFLRDVLKALPTGVMVQDEHGQFLLVNDAAAAQFGMTAPGSAASQDLQRRRDTGMELLRTGQSAVIEEKIGGAGHQVLLATYRPAQIADRHLLISCSVDISQQKAIEERLSRSVHYDDLTELPTRHVIEHRIHRLVRSDANRCFALAVLDVDNFKNINDFFGYPSGDALLVELAKRLLLNLRETDTLSRISGDKFLLLLDPVQSQAELDEFIAFMLTRLKAPFFIDGTELFASTSIGVCLYPAHGERFEVLLQNADIALNRVKSTGKGAAALFDSSMEREAFDRTKIEQALRLAILERRFCCAFQPKVDIKSREIKGVEALVRLRDDEGVIKAPGTFVKLAVELGLIDELTHMVLAEIVQSIDLINDTFGRGASISINIAAGQAGNVEFMRDFAKALEATGFPRRFMIEVTEDAFVAKTHFQTDILPIFHQLGVGVSIDDFGIGYSSLSALADITADEIKIDRSFITDIHQRPRSQGILRAIESLGEALGMSVIAEGIESAEELAYLRDSTNIRYAQGYYFSRPIMLEELKPSIPLTSEARFSLASRPQRESRGTCARVDRYGRR